MFYKKNSKNFVIDKSAIPNWKRFFFLLLQHVKETS